MINEERMMMMHDDKIVEKKNEFTLTFFCKI